ncbi:peptidoglycan DD-metalloendopeptidase family protein [Arthrobacter sp. B2a2-09]|uniref:peptidoglycan DD-metalloendopeptidase family protein n=1 Tax=Arthrobacter sp. B2a2-09 TaxID=2952822 RepID=UPI0022CD2902|nr:peptidoglycan DD-metalloendopeptidase family protein [Arthrobacter sp. B2a2-09]MCZ9884155.1 peptidoglycan DD-metalloendopeptidase family protein [Arthrobacter sp. B2a2-09]
MPTIGVADILVVPVFKDLQKKVGKELDAAASSAGDSAGKSLASKLTGAVGGFMSGTMKAAGIAGGLTVGAAFGTALAKGFGRLQAIEEAKAKLSGLGHSAETVQGIMNDAMAAVKGTAFGLGDAATVAAGAVAAGVKPGKDLERTLKLTGDAATIAGVGMGEMGAIFNKVSASNKIQGDVIAQLNDAGIPIIQLLGKELGKSAEETVNLASQGKINFETFQNAMEKGLGGAALKSGETLRGAFKNTIASVGRIGASLLSGVYPKIQQFFAGAINWLKPLEEGAKVAGAAIGVFLDKVLTGAKGIYDLLSGKGSEAFEKAFKVPENSPIVDFLFRLRGGLIGLYDLLVKGDFSVLLRSSFGWEEDSKIVAFLLTLREEVKKIPGALGKVIGAAKDVAKWLWDMREPIGIIVGLIVVSLIPHWVALGVEAMKSAIQQKIAWGITKAEAIKAAFAHSWAVTTMIAGWVLMGTQATIQAVKIAAAWLISLGWVGLIIAIVAALVAGFIWAYNNLDWFRAGVDAAMKWISDAVSTAFQWVHGAIAAVVDWFTGTAVPAWQSAIQAVGDFFTYLWTDWIKPAFDGIAAIISWVYESVIKPIFDGISFAVGIVGAIFSWLYTTILKPVFDSAAVVLGGFYLLFRGIFQVIVSIIQNILAPLFMWWWNNVMVPVFQGIGSTIADWWNSAVSIFNGAIGFVRDVLAAVFTWFHDAIIKPVFDAIGAAISWVSDNVIKPVVDAWNLWFGTILPAAFTWLYNNVIKPVFDAIGQAINWVWLNVIKPTIDTWVYFFQNILGPAVNWLYQNVVKPAFDGIGSAIKWVWENVIKPVFDTLSDFITKTIPKAFEDGVGFIKKFWDGLQEIAKAPVRFVVDTVINDGLIGAFNTIAGILPGVDKLPRVALPKGFMNGGYTGDGAEDEPAGIVHGGEFVFTKEQTRRAGVRNLYALADSLAGYMNGGFVNPLKQMVETQGYNRVHKGVDYAASVGTPVFATENGRVSWSGPGIAAPGVWGGNEIHVDGGSGIQTWFAHLSSMAVKVGEMVRAGQQIALSGNTGITSGPHLHFGTFNGGWPNDIDPHGYLGGAGIPSGGGFNPFGGIIDGLLSQFKSAFPAAGIMADIAIGIGKKLFSTVADVITGGGKGSAIGDPALYDLGGILPPGVSQVVNRTGQPEAILNPQQWADIHRLATLRSESAGGRGDVIFKGNVGWDPDEVANRIETKRRDTFAAFGI